MYKKGLSKNNKKVVTLLSFATIVLVIIFAFGFKIFDVNYDNKTIKNEKIKDLNISEIRIKTIFEETIKNRRIKIIKDKIFVGENEKQIENGYYDLKVHIQNNKCIVITLNKLWEEFDEKLYQEEYVTEIAESINNILEINISGKEISDYILLGYNIAKNSQNEDELNKEYILDLEEFELKGEVLDKEFVISIYRK